jgi:aldehyde dehydrogenase (NAD+)
MMRQQTPYFTSLEGSEVFFCSQRNHRDEKSDGSPLGHDPLKGVSYLRLRPGLCHLFIFKNKGYGMKNYLKEQRSYAFSPVGRSLKTRKKWLKTLRQAIIDHKESIIQALKDDLRKPELEIYGSELSIVLQEINHTLKKLRRWSSSRWVGWGKRIIPSPYGATLIIGPWNYPFQLLFTPLVSALAAGNGITIKPSELAPATEKVIAGLIPQYFPPEVLTVVTGGPEVSAELVDRGFDKIFFTGSPAVGAKVASSAAKHFTNLTLELGGKSPAIVAPKGDFVFSIRRITWGKVLNSGQTCIAPDYLLVPKGRGPQALKIFEETIAEFYGKNPQESQDLGRIINHRHFDRLMALVRQRQESIPHDREDLYIQPSAFLAEMDDPLMQEEIFGPFLPILEYQDLTELKAMIAKNPNPLALYLFGEDRSFQEEVMQSISFGGGAINEVILHIQGHELPFGGVGKSGHGTYHGKAGFEAFSHYKSVLSKSQGGRNSFLYPPYSDFPQWVRKLIFGL